MNVLKYNKVRKTLVAPNNPIRTLSHVGIIKRDAIDSNVDCPDSHASEQVADGFTGSSAWILACQAWTRYANCQRATAFEKSTDETHGQMLPLRTISYVDSDGSCTIQRENLGVCIVWRGEVRLHLAANNAPKSSARKCGVWRCQLDLARADSLAVVDVEVELVIYASRAYGNILKQNILRCQAY
jgi:hypothetical protein